MQRLYCYRNQLTELNVQECNALQVLFCNGNQLTSLNVQGLSALKELKCYRNQLNVQALTSLLTGLPARPPSDEAKCILYTESFDEGTLMEVTVPAELYTAFQNAKTKNWRLYTVSPDGNDVELD